VSAPPTVAFAALDAVSELHADGDTLRMMVSGSTAPVVRAASRHELVDFSSREPSLEDTFLAQYGRQARHEVEHERAPAREAGVQQDHEVADLVRDLVRHHRQRGDETQLHIDEERARDDDTIGEVVEGIANENRQSATPGLLLVVPVRVMVQVAFVMVRVVDERQLFEQEEA